MKKSFYFLNLFSLLFLNAYAQPTTVQWEQPLLVSNGAQYGSNRPRITLTAPDSAVIVWGQGGNIRLARRSLNGFTQPVLVNPGLSAYNNYWTGVDVAAHGDHVFISFNGSNINLGNNYLVRSINGGRTLEVATLIPKLPNTISFLPTVSVDPNGNPSVMYIENGANWTDPRYAVVRSPDGGNSWLPRIDVSANAPHEVCDCCPASIVQNGQNVAAIFRNNDLDIRDMWTSFSTDGGATYSQSFDCDSADWNFPACPSSGPDAVLSPNKLYSTWMSQIGGEPRIMVAAASLNNNLLTQEASHVLVDNVPAGTLVNYPRMAGSGDTLGIIWQEVVQGKGRLLFVHSVNGLAGLSRPDTLWQDLNDNLRSPDISYSNGNFYIVWDNQTSHELYYRKGTITLANDVPILPSNTMPVKVFPNPFDDQFTFELGALPSAGSVMELYDLTGRLCMSQAADMGTTLTLDGKNLAKGVYVWRLRGATSAMGMIEKR